MSDEPNYEPSPFDPLWVALALASLALLAGGIVLYVLAAIELYL